MDGKRKFDVFLLIRSDANTFITASYHIPKQEFSAFDEKQKQANKGNIRLPVGVRSPNVCVLYCFLKGREPRSRPSSVVQLRPDHRTA